MGGSLNLIASLAVDSSAVGPGVAEAEAKIKTFAANSAAAVESVNSTSMRMAQTLRDSGATAEQAAQIFKQMGVSGAEAGRAIETAFRAATTSVGRTADQAQRLGPLIASAVTPESMRTFQASVENTLPPLRGMTQELRAAEQVAGVRLPRAFTSMIAQMPELQGAIAAAFQAAVVV